MKKNTFKLLVLSIALMIVIVGVMAFDTGAAEKLIRKGDTGENVYLLQEYLIESGYLIVPADGIFGEYTLEALKKFQEEYGLEVTGETDSDTLALLSSLSGCIQTDPEAKPVKTGYFRNIEINAFSDGSYRVEPNTISNLNLQIAHDTLLKVVKAYKESESVPEADLAAAITTNDPEVPLLLIRDLTDEDVPGEGTTVRYYDLDTFEPATEELELSAEMIALEKSYVFRNILAEIEENGEMDVVLNTVSDRSLEEARKIYAAIKYAYLNSDEIPEDETELVEVDVNALPDGVSRDDIVYDEASENYYVARSLMNEVSGYSGQISAVKDLAGNVSVISIPVTTVSNSGNTSTQSNAYNEQAIISNAHNVISEAVNRYNDYASQTNASGAGTNNTMQQSNGSHYTDNPATVPSSASEPAVQNNTGTPSPTAETQAQPETTTALAVQQPATEPSVQAHTHNWQPVYKTVHHDAVTHQEPVYSTVHHDAVTHEETVYDQVWVDDQVIQGEFLGYASVNIGCCVCHTCGGEFITWEEYDAHTVPGGGWCDSDGYRTAPYYIEDTNQPIYDQVYIPGHYEQVSVGTQTVVDQPAYDEQVLKAYNTVVDQAAYDEQVVDYYVCSGCGATK